MPVCGPAELAALEEFGSEGFSEVTERVDRQLDRASEGIRIEGLLKDSELWGGG